MSEQDLWASIGKIVDALGMMNKSLLEIIQHERLIHKHIVSLVNILPIEDQARWVADLREECNRAGIELPPALDG